MEDLTGIGNNAMQCLSNQNKTIKRKATQLCKCGWRPLGVVVASRTSTNYTRTHGRHQMYPFGTCSLRLSYEIDRGD